MSLIDLVARVSSLASPVLLIIIIYLLTHPEKVEKWASILFRFLAYISKRAERRYVATNIQATISEKRQALGLDGDVLSYGVKIKWTEEKSAEIDLVENKVLVMMKPFKSQAKNLASIVSLYVPKALLPKARRYIDPDVITGIDFIIGKTILENNSAALNYFVERKVEDHTENVKEVLTKIEPIHSVGHLTRVVIPEFKRLSGLYPLEPNKEVFKETSEFLKEIHTFESTKPGTDDGILRGVYNGEHIKMAIVPVARFNITGMEPHINWINRRIEEGIENFYIVAAGQNKLLAVTLIQRAYRECGISLVFEEDYEGFFRGAKRKMYCALCTKETLS